MDLRQLRYFMQVVEAGSISRAAEALHIVQPSLSLQIKSLENELGVPLLIRHVRGVTPTDQGRLLYDHARRILSEVTRAKEDLQLSSTSTVGRIAVGIPTSACRGLACHLLRAARERYPELSVHVFEAMTGALALWLESGRLDVALLYDNKASENVAWTEMMTEDLMLIVHQSSELAVQESVDFSRLEDLPLVLPGRPNVLRGVLERQAARQDIELNVVADCDSLPTLVQLVFHGYVTVLPHFAVSEEIARRELVAVPILNPAPFWRLSVVLSKRTLNVPGAQAASELLAETIGDLVRSGAWRARALGD